MNDLKYSITMKHIIACVSQEIKHHFVPLRLGNMFNKSSFHLLILSSNVFCLIEIISVLNWIYFVLSFAEKDKFLLDWRFITS